MRFDTIPIDKLNVKTSSQKMGSFHEHLSSGFPIQQILQQYSSPITIKSIK